MTVTQQGLTTLAPHWKAYNAHRNVRQALVITASTLAFQDAQVSSECDGNNDDIVKVKE